MGLVPGVIPTVGSGSRMNEGRIEAQIHAWRGNLWVRVSAQIYNDLADIERLAEAVTA